MTVGFCLCQPAGLNRFPGVAVIRVDVFPDLPQGTYPFTFCTHTVFIMYMEDSFRQVLLADQVCHRLDLVAAFRMLMSFFLWSFREIAG